MAESSGQLRRHSASVVCPRCNGKGTVVKDGPHPDEYDNKYPCPLCCPWPSRDLVGSGRLEGTDG